MEITAQIHFDGGWHDAATVEIKDQARGIMGPSELDYHLDYWIEMVAGEGDDIPVIDRMSVSVQFPVVIDPRSLDRWPAWLLDLMPQGIARTMIAHDLNMRADDPAVEIELLKRAGGSPVGNIRIREAWEAEQDRLSGLNCPPLTDQDIQSANDRFLDVVDQFALLASGSSGVQGEWPKALMTRSKRDGFWYPDPFVETQDGAEHVIVKLLKSSSDNDRLIHEAEAPYLELARAFGLNCAEPLRFKPHALVMPRFDREVRDGEVLLHGQESFTSAMGITGFGVRCSHEDYLTVIDRFSDDPIADRIEYLLRDVLNIAVGNPDNHGRNTALRRHAGGGVRLAPLFDFAPMRLSDAGIARQSRWACLGGRDPEGDWGAVCEAVSCHGLSAEDVRHLLIEKLDNLRNLDRTAKSLGVSSQVIRRAFQVDRIISVIEALEGPKCQL